MSVPAKKEDRKVWLYKLYHACDVPEHQEMYKNWLRFKEYERVHKASRQHYLTNYRQMRELRLLWERNRAEFEWSKRQIGYKDREIRHLRGLLDRYYGDHQSDRADFFSGAPDPDLRVCHCEMCEAVLELRVTSKEKKDAKRARRHEQRQADRRRHTVLGRDEVPVEGAAERTEEVLDVAHTASILRRIVNRLSGQSFSTADARSEAAPVGKARTYPH